MMVYLTYKFTLGQQYSQPSVSTVPHLDGYSMLQALDVESLLHYATLYKGLEHPRIFVYAGGGGAGINPPLVTRNTIELSHLLHRYFDLDLICYTLNTLDCCGS